MRITTIPIAIVLLGVIVTGMAAFFNDANDLSLVSDSTTLNTSYNRIVEIGNITGEVNTLVGGTAGGGDSGSFLTDVKEMWGSVKTMFKTFGQVSDVTANAGTDLQIPSYIRNALLVIISIAFLGLLISIAVRWRASRSRPKCSRT